MHFGGTECQPGRTEFLGLALRLCLVYLSGSGCVFFDGTENDLRVLDRLENKNVVEGFGTISSST